MTATADKIKAEALAIFDGPECPQETRDVIEWFYSSMLVEAERRANGFMSRATYATSGGAGYKQISFRFAELEDAEQLRIWAESYSAKAGVLQQEQAGWISVNEKMPTPHTQVIAYSERNGVVMSHWCGADYTWFGITHWQPLPAAPKQGENP